MKQDLGSCISMKLIFELLPIFVVLTHHPKGQSKSKQTNYIVHALSGSMGYYTLSVRCVRKACTVAYFVGVNTSSIAISSDEIII